MDSVQTPTGEVFYVLTRKKVKNINLRVKADGVCSVSAPARVPLAEIEAFIARSAPRILARPLRQPAPAGAWTDAECRAFFAELNDEIAPLFVRYGVPKAQIKVKNMTSRWGSCAVHRGFITLSRRLMDAPRPCAAAVLLHEYAHFVVPNHGKEFYRLVEGLLPQYRLLKKQLEASAYL